MKLKNLFKTEFLNTYTEIHAFTIGIYVGLTEWKGIDDKTMQNPDVCAEIHYAYGGYITGTILRWVMIIILLNYGVCVI